MEPKSTRAAITSQRGRFAVGAMPGHPNPAVLTDLSGRSLATTAMRLRPRAGQQHGESSPDLRVAPRVVGMTVDCDPRETLEYRRRSDRLPTAQRVGEVRP